MKGAVEDVTMDGGLFEGFGGSASNLTLNSGEVNIEAGNYRFDPTAYVSGNRYVVDNGNGVYTVGNWKFDNEYHWAMSENREIVQKSEHTVPEWKTKTAASCTAPEIEEGVCAVCGATVTREGDPILEHSYTEWGWHESKHWKKCSCGATETAGVHVYGDWTVTKQPTTTEEGARERSCLLCKYVAEEKIPAKNEGKTEGGKDNGMSVGGLIVLSSCCFVLTAGACAFVIVWFKVKKKTWQDIVNLFRKK
jgi:hypothetical protein